MSDRLRLIALAVAFWPTISLANEALSTHGLRATADKPGAVLRVGADLFVGPTPDGAAMRRLHGLGVRTLVSVDGAPPEVELASKYGLRYVHVPIGYEGVPHDAALALTRVARESSGGVYVHCHQGRHRGPAAAAVVARVSGLLATDADVRALLTRAGTDRRFTGLWRDAVAYRPPPPNVPLPKLVAVADIDPLAASMAAAGRAWQRLRDDRRPGEPANSQQAALLLREAFRESARAVKLRSDSRDNAEFVAWLGEAEATAALLEKAKANPAFDRLFASLENQCQRCHEQYRD